MTLKIRKILNKIKTILIIISVTAFYSFIALYIGSKAFQLYDSNVMLDYITKKPMKSNPFTSKEGLLTNLFLEKKMNGMIRRSSWDEKYVDEKTNQVLYDHKFNISEIGSRVNKNLKSNVKKHLIVAGDSQVFGMGVSDEQVFTNLLNKKYNSFNTYNMGHPAWSPSSSYLFFDKNVGFDLNNYIKEKKGVMVYIMFPYLTLRDAAYPNTLHFTNGLLTNYEKDGDDLILKGTFKESSNFWLNLKKLATYYDFVDFTKKYIVPLFYFYNKKSMMQDYYKHSSFIISKIRKGYNNVFPGGKFYVMVCDNTGKDKSNLLQKELLKVSLNIIDLKDKKVCNSQVPFSYSENHLNADGHKEIFKLVEERVLKVNKSLLDI
jgi:hypothetical protein